MFLLSRVLFPVSAFWLATATVVAEPAPRSARHLFPEFVRSFVFAFPSSAEHFTSGLASAKLFLLLRYAHAPFAELRFDFPLLPALL